jgi:hypothetical protein
MNLQDESLPRASALKDLEDDYAFGVIHVAWDWSRTSDELTLLFGFVELLPSEIPPSIDDYDYRSRHCSHALGKNSDHCVYARHAVVSSRQALDWYLACRVEKSTLPLPSEVGQPESPSSSLRLRLSELAEDPQWPTLVSNSDDSDTLPFVPQWIECPRTHHLLPTEPLNIRALWSESEREQAEEWLTDALHFNFRERSEYWGSLHLVAPNPVYRSLAMRLQPRSAGAESVLLRFHPRAGRSVSSLIMTVQEKDPWGVTARRSIDVRSPLVRLNFEREVHAVMADVVDSDRGPLAVSALAHTFLKSIQMSFGLSTRTRVSTGRGTYEVQRSGEPETVMIGQRHTVSASRTRMLEAYYRRRNRQQAESQDQRWFRDQPEEARSLLRSLLNGATGNVLIIDPYFGPDELADLPSVARYDIPIRVLSSAKGLTETLSKDSDIEKGDALLANLDQLRTHARMNPVEIRVMPGKEPAVHDRFIVVDTRVWILGSSIHSFGLRGTMMLAIPDPDPVLADLLTAWEECATSQLDVWVEKRRRGRAAPGGVAK